MKQEILTAARHCETTGTSNPGSTDQLDKTSEETSESPLNKFADQVNAEVVSCINQVSPRPFLSETSGSDVV